MNTGAGGAPVRAVLISQEDGLQGQSTEEIANGQESRVASHQFCPL